MHRTLTTSLPDDVYQSLRARVGDGDVNAFFETLIRPVLAGDDLDAAHREMVADEEREREALEWIEADLGDTLE